LRSKSHYLENHPEVDIVYGSVRYFKTEAPKELLYTAWAKTALDARDFGHGKDVLASVLERNFMVINSPLVRRRVIDLVASWTLSATGRDWDYWTPLRAAGVNFQYEDLPGTLALVRWHALIRARTREEMYTSVLRIRRKVKSLTDDSDLRALNRKEFIKEQESLTFETILHGPLRTTFEKCCARVGTAAQRNTRSSGLRARVQLRSCRVVIWHLS
jgi:hypothetical protein